MDIQKEMEQYEAVLKESGYSHRPLTKTAYGYTNPITQFGFEIWFTTQKAAKAQAVPEGFVLVPERNVHDHYIANHLKGTTCSVDVSELTGNDGDRIYGKLRSFDCLGSDGNTLIYDLESSNFNLVKTTGNTGDFVLVEKTKLMQIIGSAAIIEPITRGNPLMSKYKTELEFILSTVRAMIEAQEQSHENG